MSPLLFVYGMVIREAIEVKKVDSVLILERDSVLNLIGRKQNLVY